MIYLPFPVVQILPQPTNNPNCCINAAGKVLFELKLALGKLVTSLRTAVEHDGVLVNEETSYNDIFDAFRLALRYYKINQSEKRQEQLVIQQA